LFKRYLRRLHLEGEAIDFKRCLTLARRHPRIQYPCAVQASWKALARGLARGSLE